MKKIIFIAAIILTTGITALSVGAKKPITANNNTLNTEKVDLTKSNSVKADISAAD